MQTEEIEAMEKTCALLMQINDFLDELHDEAERLRQINVNEYSLPNEGLLVKAKKERNINQILTLIDQNEKQKVEFEGMVSNFFPADLPLN